jgi:phosphoglycerate dehydrogenase-like enzyme
MKKAMLLSPEQNRDSVFGEQHVESLRKLVDLKDCCRLVGDLQALKPHLGDVEIICSTWGMMKVDEEFLAAAPELKAIFYGAGTVRRFATDAMWDRGILLTSAAAANAVSVAEFTIALITLGAKGAFDCNKLTRENRTFVRREDTPGLHHSAVGVVGVGAVGRRVLELLRDYEVHAYCYDPFLEDDAARELGATPLPLDEIFRRCDVLSVHAPDLPSTRHMITGGHLRSMKDGAVFVNTARGAIVKEDELIEELKRGRIFACLDVTDPEPPAPDSALYDLPNVFLTPHLAGTAGGECRRLGAYVVEEVRRYCAGEPPAYPVTRDMMNRIA